MEMTGIRWLALLAIAVLLGGCGTTHATIDTSRGESLMLLGYDPVAYFTESKPVRGKHTLAAQHEGRTYSSRSGTGASSSSATSSVPGEPDDPVAR